MNLLLTSPIGDPLSARTWSGTPRNLALALESAGCHLKTLDASIGGWRRDLAKWHNRLGGLGRHYVRGPLYRHFCAKKVIGHARHLRISAIFHTSTFTVASRNLAAGMRQFIYCDSTWDLARQAPGAERRSRQDESAEYLERLAYQRVEHIFCTAEYVRENLLEHYGLRPELVTAVGTGRSSVVQPYSGEKDFGGRKVVHPRSLCFL